MVKCNKLMDKLYDAKIGLMDLTDTDLIDGISVKNNLVQRRLIYALEAIDDVLTMKNRRVDKNEEW